MLKLLLGIPIIINILLLLLQKKFYFGAEFQPELAAQLS